MLLIIRDTGEFKFFEIEGNAVYFTDCLQTSYAIWCDLDTNSIARDDSNSQRLWSHDGWMFELKAYMVLSIATRK